MSDQEIKKAAESISDLAQYLGQDYLGEKLAFDLAGISNSLSSIANAIHPFKTVGGTDASGTYVASLTEAVGGITGGLCRIADAIEMLAEAIESKKQVN